MDTEAIKAEFDEARKLYPNPIGKRGIGPEYFNFIWRSKHPVSGLPKFNPSEVVVLLKPAIEAQIACRKRARGFVPQWKMFSTWINQHCWTEEVPEVKKPKPEIRLCACGCGRPARLKAKFGDRELWWYSMECRNKIADRKSVKDVAAEMGLKPNFQRIVKQVTDGLP